MDKNRKDNKGRVLRTGECQLQSGKYRFKYQDEYGNYKYLYSWKLDRLDRVPANKKKGPYLREQEQKLELNSLEHISEDGENMTVLELVERYLETKTGVKESTKAGYRTTLSFLKKDPMGARKISSVRVSDAKIWLIRLQKYQGKKFSTLHNIRGVLRPAFQMAMDDELVRRNPFQFELATVLKNDGNKREALTYEQMNAFLDFVKNDPHFLRYYEGIYILFHTGLRISEFVGLTRKDIDFQNHLIHVDHQLVRYSDMSYHVETTKTTNGVRDVTMTAVVEAAFRAILSKRKSPKAEPMIDRHTGFLYLDKNGQPPW